MRLFEILLMSGIILSMLNLIIIKNNRLKIVLPAFSVLFATVSIIFEGYRLQMVPAYVLSLFLLLPGILTIAAPNIKPPKFIKVSGFILSFIVLALSITAIVFFPVINLPKPSGSYQVGTVLLDFTDYSRKGIITSTEEYRRIPVQIWYPASDTTKKKRANWLSSTKVSEAFAECKNVPNLFDQLSLVKTNSYWNAVLSKKEEKYPVILFSGGGAMFNGQNVVQMEELASHGYVVCSVGHPYDDFACIYPDGSIIKINNKHLKELSSENREAVTSAKDDIKKEIGGDEKSTEFLKYLLRHLKDNKLNNIDAQIWSDDMSFVADQLLKLNNNDTDNIFKGKLDMSDLGIFGHSFGGAAAGEACLHDKRFKAFINMDGTPFGSAFENVIQQPFMILTVGKDKQRLIRDAYLPTQKNFTTVYIQGAEHMNFSDFNTILPVIGKAIGMLDSIKPERQKLIMNDYILSFFNHYLKGMQEPLLDSTLSKYPEVTVVKR